jgi:uncharacterized protein YjbJ (UPF0337 family)
MESVQKAVHNAQETMAQAGDKISQTAQQMTHSAQEAMGQAKDNAGQATQQVRAGVCTYT